MARFDIYRFDSKAAPFVLDVQASILSDLASCVVIPLGPAEARKTEELPRLKPMLRILDKDYVLITTDIAAIPRYRLGEYVTNIEDPYRDQISNALDFLFVGF